MKHIDFDNLYHLATLTIDDAPLDELQIEQMNHIADCKDCYDEFCSIMAILEVTNESGMIAVRKILSDKLDSSEDSVVQKVLAVISVRAKVIKEQISVIMEQLQSDFSGLCFEAPLAMAARNVEPDTPPKISKLEDIENEKTFILFDPALGSMYVQLDIRDLTSDAISVYLNFPNKKKKEIPLTREGYILKGELSNITDTDFEIIITQ